MKFPLIAASLTLAASLMSSTSALAADGEGPWQIRVRAIVVNPDESADIQTLGGDVDITNSITPELDITYFFNDNLSAELILATSQHKIKAVGTAVGDLNLGKTWVLPPTVTLQYHLAPGKTFNPYVGAGVNYTIFYSHDLDTTVLDNVDLDSSFGFALQAGADININPDSDWFFNVDVKKIWMQSDATVNATTALGATVSADVDINPWVWGVGVGRRF